MWVGVGLRDGSKTDLETPAGLKIRIAYNQGSESGVGTPGK